VVAIALLLFQDAAARASRLVDAAVELSNRGQFPAAAARLVEALSMDARNAEAHYLLGLIRQQDGRAGAAMESFRAALKVNPAYGQAQARVCELETAAARGREAGYAEALATCRRAAALDPRDAEPLVHAGWLQGRLGQHAAAIQSLRAALRRNPALPGARLELAMAHVESGAVEQAVPLLKQALQARPADAGVRFQLGAALAKSKEGCAAAVPYLEAATPSSQQQFVLAGCYRKLGRNEEAAAALARVAEDREAANARAQARYQAAVAHRKAESGDVEGAVPAYRESLRLAADEGVKIDLAVALLKTGRPAEVLELLAGDGRPVALYQTALALGRQDRHRDAKQALEKAIEGRPGFVEAWYQLGVTLHLLGDGTASGRAFDRAVELRPDDPALRRRP